MKCFLRLFHRDRVERELDAELRFHLEQQAADNIREGMSEEDAWRCARNQFGGLEQVKEDCRDARGTRWAEDAGQDLRLALRVLAKNRSFTLTAVITLALGIGANVAMFSVIEAVLVRGLPYADPDRMVWITERNVTARDNLAMVFGTDLHNWRQHARSLDALSVLLTGDVTMDADEPLRVRVACVSQGINRLFGVEPVLGRDFLPGEFESAPLAPGLRGADRRGSGIAVLSGPLFWRLGGDPGLLGQPITIADVVYTVVGVLPDGFRLPVAPSLQLGIGPRRDVDLVLNTSISPEFRGPGALVGRLKPGVPLGTALAELEGLQAATNESRPGPSESPDLKLQLVPLHEHVVANSRRVLLMLWASAVLVLAVACANIVSLLLARSFARRRDTAVRSALGAGRWRLVRQSLAESVVLAFAGGLAGVALAYAVLRVLPAVAAIDIPRLTDAALNENALFFGVIVCMLTALVLGFVPALRTSPALLEELRVGPATTLGSAGVRRWHNALVVGELALALIPLAGAGLMLRSLSQVRTEGALLAPEQVLTARIQPNRLEAAAPSAEALQLNDRFLESIEALPGVQAAALWSATFGYPARIAGLPPAGEDPIAMWFSVSPQFRDASGIQLLAGRWFTVGDRTSSAPVVVVSERFARRFAADLATSESIVGRTTFGPFPPRGASEREGPMTIIGIVSDFRSGRFGILQPDDPNGLPQVFFPDALRPTAQSELLVRAASNPLGLVSSIRRIVARGPGTRLVAVRRLDDEMSTAIAPRRFNTTLIVAFGMIALVLATVGVSGVVRYSVVQRTREIGLRIALGARSGSIHRMILSRVGGLVATGLAIGLIGSAALSHLIRGVLYGVSPLDPTVYAGVCLLLVASALASAYQPVRRAVRLDPMAVLRTDL